MKNSISNSIGSSNVNAGVHNGNGKNSFGMTASNVIEEQSEMNENVMDAIAKKIKYSKHKSNTGVMNSTNPVSNHNLIQNLMIGKFNSLYPKSVEKDAKVNSNSLYSISNANVSGQSATKLNLTK